MPTDTMPAEPVEGPRRAEPVTLPVETDDIARIASRGYPLWEPVEVMQLRNRRITVAYSNLSQRLADLVANGDTRDANWCTFGTWTSKTVGDWIGTDVMPEPLRKLRGIPAVVLQPVVALARWLPQRSNGASYRCLAAGNRFVFLEIGYAVALFLERFGDIDRKIDDERWSAYREDMTAHISAMSQLDPSWLLTDAPPPEDLLLGLRQYYEALFAEDGDERAELMLAGNLLIGAYEQRRVDGYVSASLALFTKRAMRNLVRQRSGVVTGWLHRWPSKIFSMVMTRGLVLNTCDEQFKVGRPLPALLDGSGRFSLDLSTITNPLVQALLTRYDLSEGTAARCRVRDWTSFDERMSYITNLFRSRQQHAVLFSSPFPADVEAALLRGSLDSAETGD